MVSSVLENNRWFKSYSSGQPCWLCKKETARSTNSGYPPTVDLPGNERADVLAREASALPQEDVPTDLRTLVEAGCRPTVEEWLAGGLLQGHHG